MPQMYINLKKLTNLFRPPSIFFAEEHRKFLKAWLIYVAILALLYMVFPVTLERNWLEFFEPLRDGYIPYIDFHVGYPPIGFLPYSPLALISNFKLTTFVVLMRTSNLFFLAMSVLLIYFMIYKVRGKRDATISALVVMFSFSTFNYNKHSNESIALFLALVAVNFMLGRKACSTGLAIGLGAMTKILPGLLVIPAIKRLELAKDRVLLLGSACMFVLFLNLPFMIASPFMWLSTYVYNGARGPWETIWALIEGWYGHGGSEALHPYFEGFIPYSQLMTIYPPKSYDHAFYAWNYPWLPTLLFVLGGASLLLSYWLINRRDVTEGVALTLFLFVYFSKGYSPQFTMFMLPFMAMAFEGNKKICLCAMLEIGTILQLLVWWPGLYSPLLLASGVILRTMAFTLAIALLVIHFTKQKKAIKLPVIRGLKDKFLAIFIISVLTAGGSVYYLINHYSQFPLTIETRKGTMDMKLYGTAYLSIPNLTKNDRVMFNLTSTGLNDVSVTKDDEEIWTTKTPNYNVKNLFVCNDLADYSLVIYMAYPASSFKIIDETNGDGKGEIEQIGEALNVTVVDFGKDLGYSILRLSWLVENLVVADDFKAKMMVQHFSGHVNRTLLVLSSSSASVVYKYEIPLSDEWSGFEVNSSSLTFDGLPFSRVKGKRIEAISIVFMVDDGKNASIGLKELEVWNKGKGEKLDLNIEKTSQTLYEIYVAHAYSLNNDLMMYVVYSLFVAGTTMAWLSIFKTCDKGDKPSK